MTHDDGLHDHPQQRKPITKIMKKTLLLIASIMLVFTSARADEGMWLLKLMKMQHLEDSLRKAGLQLPTKELYSETSPSLRECVGIFGNGCTGEIVSPDGLVFTNNHCGFGFVHAMSTMEHNYLQDGYFAKSRAEELRVPGLSFTFVQRIDEVTKEVEKAGRKAGVDEFTMQSQSFLEGIAQKLLAKSKYAGKPGIRVRLIPFFDGNKFFIFYEQTYPDVRLVVNPPQNIAQFGFNQDNWLWPRHNADFAVFRIYADEKGQPAEYAESNVPLKREKFLPISLKGLSEGDYTMIMGFPGTTTRYLTASEVQLRTQSVNRPVHMAGDAQLTFMKKVMDSDSVMNLKLADEYMSLGNVVKNYGGMNESVKKTGLLKIKKKEEAAFRKFAAKSKNKKYADIIERIDSLTKAAADTLFDYNLCYRTISQQGFKVSTRAIERLITALEGGKTEEIEAAKAGLRKAYAATMSDIDLTFDRQVVDLLIPYWQKHARLSYGDGIIPADTKAYYDNIYGTSLFRSKTTFEDFLKNPSAEVLKNDPLYKHQRAVIDAEQKHFADAIKRYRTKRVELDKIYTRGLCEMHNWSKAPDANFTLRMTYGKTTGYVPRDGVTYHWQTVLDGMLEKENPADPDYVMNEELRKYYDTGDYGRYARPDGKLPVCFIANNDITGGNSGSPVLNAKGELIGLAFDGNIESLSSDLRYNPALQRCICVDARYVLFLIDIYGGSKYLLNEMDIRE